jgi:tetratricopeptide (TPR) repeat protein
MVNLMKIKFTKAWNSLLGSFATKRKWTSLYSAIKNIRLDSWNNPTFDRTTKYQILSIGLISAFLFLFYIGTAAKQLSAFALASYGFHLNEKRLWAKSIDAFNASVWLSEGNDSYSYFGRAYAEDELGKSNSALKDYNQAIVLDEKNACIYNNRGLTHEARGENALALADYNKSTLLSPKHAQHLIDRGRFLKKSGRTKEALRDFTNANEIADSQLKEDANDPDNYGDKASALYELGLPDQALSNIQEAIKRAPDKVDFRLIRAKIFLAQHNLANALSDIKEYISANLYDQEGYLELAKIHEEIGNTTVASINRSKAAALKQQARNSS